MARSTITVSFDHWLVDNELDLLGVVAHYLGRNLELKSVLLALKPSYGHDAQELQDTLLSVLREYKISDRIGYFIADNAANNDAALRLLPHHIDVKPAKQRLRCSGHVINLVVKAILYGVDSECMLDAALSESDHGGDSELFDTSTVSTPLVKHHDSMPGEGRARSASFTTSPCISRVAQQDAAASKLSKARQTHGCIG